MAVTVTKELFSASTNGRPVAIDVVVSPGQTIHTAGTAAGLRDNISLWVMNGSTVTASQSQVIFEFGGTTVADQVRVQVVGSETIKVAHNWPLTASTSLLRAIATATGRLSAIGYVNRMV